MAFRYISRGLIVEQAIRYLFEKYIAALSLESSIKNLHINITTDHPFVLMYANNPYSAADAFPCIVVSTQEDRKPSELIQMPPHIENVELTSNDIDTITSIDTAGVCMAAGKNAIDDIKATIKRQGVCCGYSIRTWHTDTLGVEIWAENTQLKNELYEQMRLYITGELRNALTHEYPFYATNIVDTSIVGHRSNNWNFDFGTPLAGAHIAFNVDYCTEQLVLDIEKENINSEIIQEGNSHV